MEDETEAKSIEDPISNGTDLVEGDKLFSTLIEGNFRVVYTYHLPYKG